MKFNPIHGEQKRRSSHSFARRAKTKKLNETLLTYCRGKALSALGSSKKKLSPHQYIFTELVEELTSDMALYPLAEANVSPQEAFNFLNAVAKGVLSTGEQIWDPFTFNNNSAQIRKTARALRDELPVSKWRRLRMGWLLKDRELIERLSKDLDTLIGNLPKSNRKKSHKLARDKENDLGRLLMRKMIETEAHSRFKGKDKLKSLVVAILKSEVCSTHGMYDPKTISRNILSLS